MTHRPLTSPPRARRSRAEQKSETREALIMSALVSFARDGYHGASLEKIANDAGFSKGAVYSNFGGKAELFLAIMDFNLETLRGERWDPLVTPVTQDAHPSKSTADGGDDAVEMIRGIGLATLEFITTAARDDTLIEPLRARVQVMLDANRRVAAASRPADDPLPDHDIAQLMVALDQGMCVLALSGVTSGDGALTRTGLRRLLLGSTSAVNDSESEHDRHGGLAGVEQVRHLMRDRPED